MIERVITSDGASIAVKRRPSSGPPVILLHGLAVNADIWDIGSIRGAGFEFRGLAPTLSDAGFDLWLANLRGHGAPHMLSEPPAGQSDWCVDHFVCFDLPAVVDHVRQTRGQNPFVVGSSMGAMTLAAYLTGATLRTENGREQIAADSVLAATRREQIAGGVFIEFPAELRWPDSMYDAQGRIRWNDFLDGWRRTDSNVNFAFEWLSRAAWIEAMLAAVGEVRLDWLRPDGGASRWREVVPRPIADAWQWTEGALTNLAKLYASQFKGAVHFCPETFRDGLLTAVDHMKSGVLKQMGKSVRARSFVSFLGEQDHHYPSGYQRIETPTLVIVGGRDRIANSRVTREAFFDRIGSPDKTFREFPELAHGEFEYAPLAGREVYPLIRDWLLSRSNSC